MIVGFFKYPFSWWIIRPMYLTCNGAQWTFRVLSKSYLHSPTICKGMAFISLPTLFEKALHRWHNTNLWVFCKERKRIEGTREHLKKGDGRADHTRNKGRHSCENLEVWWSSLLKSVPVSVKEQQASLGFLEDWWVLIPHLTQVASYLDKEESCVVQRQKSYRGCGPG